MGSLLEAYDRAAPFREAYAKDPYAAVARYGYLLDDNGGPGAFHLRVLADGMEEFFAAG